MKETEALAMAVFDIHEYNKEFIKENFEPVEDKPGYVWFSKRNFQIISIETLEKILDDTCGEIKEAAKMCKVDLIDEIKSAIKEKCSWYCFDDWGNKTDAWDAIESVIDEFSAESEGI